MRSSSRNHLLFYLIILTLSGSIACTSQRGQPDTNESDNLQVAGGGHTPDELFSFAVDSEAWRSDHGQAIEDAFLKEFRRYYRNSLKEESHQLYSEPFFSLQGCRSARIMEVHVKGKDDTSLVHWYLLSEHPMVFGVSHPIAEDITERQGTAEANLVLAYKPGKECPVVAIETSSIGSDIDSKTLTFYAVGNGFEEIWHVVVEDVLKAEDGGEPQSATLISKQRKFRFIEGKASPMDIEVSIDNGKTRSTEIYTWDRTTYKLKSNP